MHKISTEVHKIQYSRDDLLNPIREDLLCFDTISESCSEKHESTVTAKCQQKNC